MLLNASHLMITLKRVCVAINWTTCIAASVLACLLACLGLSLVSPAVAGIGTAQPPLPGRGTVPAISARPIGIGEIINSVPWEDIKPFTVIGFLQGATVSGAHCPGLPAVQHGGTATVNDITIIIPCNTVLQMPAAAMTWAKLFDTKFKAALTLPPTGALPVSGNGASGFSFPSTEITIHGNIVDDRYIAGLVFISQQSLNAGSGYITKLDYELGVMWVGPTADGIAQARVQLNDSAGRFSKGQSPDSRFNADDENATMRAATGYPMCVPRLDPIRADDPLCPQRNRPQVVAGCRNFKAAGVTLPFNRDLTPPTVGQVYCSSFVMGDYLIADLGGAKLPLATQQAPFQVGDFVTYQGTLLRGDGQGPGGSDTISAHTIIANVGIYTEPGKLPSYLAIEAVSISAETPRQAFTGVPQEPTNRLILEAMTTDVLSVVDAYLVDLHPVTGLETQRWITPRSMTGGLGTWGSNNDIIDGGITTQFTGPLPGRVRLQAGKSTPGILYSPTRNIRVVSRALCDPANINATAPKLETYPLEPVPCLLRAPVANGLHAGQFAAPVLDFIFPEALIPGDPAVPNNFWSFGFLVNGEGATVGPLVPKPW
jgi:hypothetical protein